MFKNKILKTIHAYIVKGGAEQRKSEQAFCLIHEVKNKKHVYCEVEDNLQMILRI